MKTGAGTLSMGKLNSSEPKVSVSPADVSVRPVKATISPVPIFWMGRYVFDRTLRIWETKYS